MTSATAIIPARYGSTRFPGKPLAADTGKFLIQHVYERVGEARRLQRRIIATDDTRIADAVRSFGGEAVLTRPDHPSGTDRIAEVVRLLGSAAGDIIINVQGDEPEIEPDYLDRLVARLEGDPGCGMATLATGFPDGVDPASPDRVKVVMDLCGRALYFSRALIPYVRDRDEQAIGADGCRLHLGVYAYRRGFLLEFAGWEPTILERVEKLEQLRALEHGAAIAIEVVERAFAGVDTAADYAAFVSRWMRSKRPG
jgi:3-deoxy-manno-octulosonate cytidylyltransferase (CMP-KDO synthetase)